jgi:cyanoexosortase A
MTPLLDRLPPWVREQIPAIPPATPRNLWLLLAALVATQNIAVFHTSQHPNTTVLVLMVWGGAVICMEDQFEHLRPQPSLVGLILGTPILLWILARSAMIMHWDGILFILAPLAGLALALLCQPLRRLKQFRDPFLCLMLIPGYALIFQVLPEQPISLLTASMAGNWLSILGLNVIVKGREVMLPTGGVTVMAACNGIDMMGQIICIGLIFLLAFPIRSNRSRLLMLLAAPLIGLVCNTVRIAILTICSSQSQGKGTFLFDFFHKDSGSLVFSGIAVFIFGVLYMRLLERELPPLEQPTEDRHA